MSANVRNGQTEPKEVRLIVIALVFFWHIFSVFLIFRRLGNENETQDLLVSQWVVVNFRSVASLHNCLGQNVGHTFFPFESVLI